MNRLGLRRPVDLHHTVQYCGVRGGGLRNSALGLNEKEVLGWGGGGGLARGGSRLGEGGTPRQQTPKTAGLVKHLGKTP